MLIFVNMTLEPNTSNRIVCSIEKSAVRVYLFVHLILICVLSFIIPPCFFSATAAVATSSTLFCMSVIATNTIIGVDRRIVHILIHKKANKQTMLLCLHRLVQINKHTHTHTYHVHMFTFYTFMNFFPRFFNFACSQNKKTKKMEQQKKNDGDSVSSIISYGVHWLLKTFCIFNIINCSRFWKHTRSGSCCSAAKNTSIESEIINFSRQMRVTKKERRVTTTAHKNPEKLDGSESEIET